MASETEIRTRKFHPMLFSTPMVQAIKEGRKTQTRRIVKNDKEYTERKKIGDILWVRETWQVGYIYKADDLPSKYIKWKPSLFMPKDACRIFLEIINIRIERLNTISKEDAIAEGIFWNEASEGYNSSDDGMNFHCSNPIKSYEKLWWSINGKENWDENPLVWVIEFKQIDKPSDFLTQKVDTETKAKQL